VLNKICLIRSSQHSGAGRNYLIINSDNLATEVEGVVMTDSMFVIYMLSCM
jgi:hypothetical protein